MKQRLPLSIQHFNVLREQNCVYVDKTEAVYELARLEGGVFFLSRPRRFGKSLFLSTIQCLFEGKKELFKGLWIENKWDWSRKNPIVHLSFTSIDYHNSLEKGLLSAILSIAQQYNLTIEKESLKEVFEDLIRQLHAKHGKVVLLIDEYDKPLIDFLELNKLHIAHENQVIMKMFYGTLKDLGASLQFVFVTGVSKFSKVSLFSDLNHVQDLTTDKRLSAACGYTQTELEHYFEDFLADFLINNPNFTRESLLENIKEWYNGYSWDAETKVYNPYGILNFFSNQRFQNYWFSSGTPTFLINKVIEQGFYEVEKKSVSLTFLEQYSLENIELTSLFFQTGYLTIKSIDVWGDVVLDYPNREVKDSMYSFIMTMLGQRNKDSRITVQHLNKAFLNNKLLEIELIIQDIFATLPYDVFKSSSESLYHGLIHILFHYVGLDVESEVHTNQGRADAIVQTPSHVYIFEFKHNSSSRAAMKQLKSLNYASKFKNSNKKIIGIGLNYTERSRKFSKWIIEEL
jgi:hypothetical protein